MCIYNEILLSHKKGKIWVSGSEVTRAYYTEWSKSERENKYINAFIWNLEKWYWWTCLLGRIGDTDVENRLVDTAGDGEGGMNWESSIDIYTLSCVKQIAGGELLYNPEKPARRVVMT